MAKRWFGFSERALCVASLLLIFSARASDTLPSYEVAVKGQAATYEVGDVLSVQILGLDPQIQVQVANPEGSGPAGFELGVITDPNLGPGFTVIPLKAGVITVSALDILELKDAQGHVIGHTAPFEFKVAELKSNQNASEQQLEPPVPPLSLMFPAWLAILIAGVMIGVVVGLFIWMKKISDRKPVPVAQAMVVTPRSEDEVALEELRRLDESGFAQRGQFKLVYFGVSEILKRYLGARFRIDALEATTRELLAQLRASHLIEDSLVSQVGEIFLRLDEIKFTDIVPSVSDAERVIKDAQALVLATKRSTHAPG